MEVMLLANNYFMVVFNYMADRNHVFEGGLISITRLAYLLSHCMLGSILRRSYRTGFQCGFVFLDFLLNVDVMISCRWL